MSEVELDNQRVRLDATYFSRLAVFTHRQVENLAHVRLGEECAVFRKGIFDIKADTYTAAGVPFVRIGDLDDGLLDDRSMAFISKDAHAAASATALRFGDFVLSKSAYASAALVTVPECNVSQDIIAARLSTDGASRLRTGYIVAYLTSRFGRALMQRQFQGNVQEHLSLADGRSLLIPLFGVPFQEQVHSTVLAAHHERARGDLRLREADQLVAHTLGVPAWTAPDPVAYTDEASAIRAADRLDAEYHHPAKQAWLDRLADLSADTLGSHYRHVRDLFDPQRAAPGDVVRNFDLTDALSPILDDSKPVVEATGIKSSKKRLLPGDVVTSRLRAYLRETALVATGEETASVGSTEFLVLRRRPASPLSQAALMVFLRSEPVQTILRWSQDGSHHPRYDADDLLRIPIPTEVCAESEVLRGQLEAVFEARSATAELLARARRAVEDAIEHSEAAGLAALT